MNNMEVELTCICCPNGCRLKVDKEKKKVSGNKCPRGEEYGINEVTHPMRIITSTIRVENGQYPVVPVKTNIPIPKELTFRCMDVINTIKVSAPVTIGEVLIENILGSGADIIACRSNN